MQWKTSEPKIFDIQGPAYQHDISDEDVKSISCDFTDELEALSVQNVPVEVVYGARGATEQRVRGFIKDFTTKEKVEFMVMSEGQEIPLKEIRRVVNLPKDSSSTH